MAYDSSLKTSPLFMKFEYYLSFAILLNFFKIKCRRVKIPTPVMLLLSNMTMSLEKWLWHKVTKFLSLTRKYIGELENFKVPFFQHSDHLTERNSTSKLINATYKTQSSIKTSRNCNLSTVSIFHWFLLMMPKKN